MNYNSISVLHLINILSIFLYAQSFITSGNFKLSNIKGSASMKWLFNRGPGSLQDMGGVGGQGELYFIPSKKPTLKAPPEALGKEVVIPIFPRNQVLGPLGEEYLGVYEMRYRQLVNDVGEGGVFGHVYYSQENSKLALVGTLSKIKRIERLEDGGIYVLMEGIGRFYLKDIKAEKPYLRATAQIFNDYYLNEDSMEGLEETLLNEIRYSVKLMKLLYPQNDYTINEAVLRNRPLVYYMDNIRPVKVPGEDSDLTRRSKFSFATMDMLKTDPITKLLFLQEPVIDKRYAYMIKVLEESTAFLEGELRRRGVVTDEGIRKLKEDALQDKSDLDLTPKSSWIPKNFVDGDWKMEPLKMD